MSKDLVTFQAAVSFGLVRLPELEPWKQFIVAIQSTEILSNLGV